MSEYIDMNQMQYQQQPLEISPQKEQSSSSDNGSSNLLESGYTAEELKSIRESLTGLIPSGSKSVRIQNKQKTYLAMITKADFTYQKNNPIEPIFYRFQFKDGQVFSKNGLLKGPFLGKFYSELDVLGTDIEKDQVNYFKA